MTQRLIALDLDGTVLHQDGTVDPDLAGHIRALHRAGHQVVIATGRSMASTLPVVEQLRIRPDWVITSNGAVTLKRDALGERGYRREYVESFDTTQVLTMIRTKLLGARYGVEDSSGMFLYTDDIEDGTLPAHRKKVTFEELLGVQANQIIVVSPDQELEEFLDIVNGFGLRHVSYAIGWSNWLDISPEGVNKAFALERVRGLLGIDRSRVIAVGDGRNDIEMLQWAGRHGASFAMAQGPEEVRNAARNVTGTIDEGGLTRVLEAAFPELLAT